MSGSDELRVADRIVECFERRYGGLGPGEFADLFGVFLGAYRLRSGLRGVGACVDAPGDDVFRRIGCCSGGEASRVVGSTFSVEDGFAGDGPEDARCPGEGVSCDIGVVDDVKGLEVETERVKGKHWKKNQKKMKNRKGKLDAIGSDWRKGNVGVQEKADEKSALRLSLEAKWQVENELKVAKAKRELELLGQQSVDEVAKLQRKKLQAALDKTMVQIEKSHATLASTGNVPGVVPQGGYCKTVLSDGAVPVLSEGCTISPDSSASMHEYNLAMKENAQLKLENAQLKKAARFSSYRERGAITLTCNSDGDLSEACEQALKDNLRPGYMEHSRDYEIAKRNGVRITQVYDESFDDSYDY